MNLKRLLFGEISIDEIEQWKISHPFFKTIRKDPTTIQQIQSRALTPNDEYICLKLALNNLEDFRDDYQVEKDHIFPHIVQYLIEKSHIDIDYIDRTGSTALMYASWKGYLEIVKYLVQHHANIDLKNLKGGTAIRYAAYVGHKDIVQYLQK